MSNAEIQFGAREWRLAYSVARKVLEAPDQAEDAAQEALLRAYRARESFAGKARFESWLYRIAFTTALGFLRPPYIRHHAVQRNEHDLDDGLFEIEAPGQSPEENARARQLVEHLASCLDSMRDIDRQAFVERFLHGTSERELGALLGMSPNAAKQRAFRARRVVRRYMQDRNVFSGHAMSGA